MGALEEWPVRECRPCISWVLTPRGQELELLKTAAVPLRADCGTVARRRPSGILPASLHDFDFDHHGHRRLRQHSRL